MRGSRQILKRTAEVRAIGMDGLHRTTDPAFLHEVLGGRLSPDRPFAAWIGSIGDGRFERVP